MNFTYIFIIRGIDLWLTLSGMLLSLLLFHKMTLLNTAISGFCLRIYRFFTTTPLPLPKLCWSGNEVYTALPLHPYHSIATLEWHCNVNLHICDALQCHFGGTLHCHSQSTLRCHSGVFLVCWFAYLRRTPMPLHKVGVASQCTLRAMQIVHSIDTPKTLYCHSIWVRDSEYNFITNACNHNQMMNE